MDGDIFATKATEYLVVIAYLVAMVIAVRWFGSLRGARAAGRHARGADCPAPLFAPAEGYHYHPGHAWVAPSEGDVVTVGLDHFTAHVVGVAEGLELPPVGAEVRHGEPGWTVRTNGFALPMLSPVEGEVVELNPDVLVNPQLAMEDPYGMGWLFRVRARNPKATLKNLLAGDLASAWLRHAAEGLRRMATPELGVVLPDGGQPVRGFGRTLGPDEWATIVREHFRAH